MGTRRRRVLGGETVDSTAGEAVRGGYDIEQESGRADQLALSLR